MGDWLDTGPGFGGKPVQDILREIKSRGREPAIWVAPFVASPDSKVLREHPDWFVKVRAGLGSRVRLCKYTNYCEALDQRHREVTCELWDREQLDVPGTVLSKDGKRRLIAPPFDNSEG
mgnify:CR=1 FL=1